MISDSGLATIFAATATHPFLLATLSLQGSLAIAKRKWSKKATEIQAVNAEAPISDLIPTSALASCNPIAWPNATTADRRA